MKVSIKIKFSLFLACLLLLTVVLLSVLVLHGIVLNQEKMYQKDLLQQSKVANLYLRQTSLKDYQQPEQFLTERGEGLAKQIALMTGEHVILYNQSGKRVGDSLPPISNVDVKQLLHDALQGQTTYQITGDTLYFFTPLNSIDKQIGVLRFDYSLKKVNEYYQKVETLFYQIGSIVFLASFLISYFYFNRSVTAILTLKKAVEKIERGQYLSALPFKRKDELGELSQGIYHMNSQIKGQISALEEEEEKLKRAINKLQELEKQQREFIGNVTHEFKTPLTVIMAYLELLGMYKDDPQLLEEAQTSIQKEAERLYEMVEKTLHLASLEKYDFASHMETIESKEVLEELCERMKVKAEKYGLRLHIDLQLAIIWADRENLNHIFINLIDNAIKYNKPYGEIWVSSRIENQRVLIQVRDTGIGIPEEMKEKVFEPFYTVNKARSRELGGTGIGLALVKKLVEKQAGSIYFVDPKGEGTAICVSFPLAK